MADLPEAEPSAPRPGGDRGRFGATVSAGIAAAALTAVACGKPWFHAGGSAGVVVADADRSVDMPLALALSLVVLAGWGALLVTRGRVRRALAGLALLAAVGVVACVVTAPFVLPGQLRDRLPVGGGHVAVTATGWFVTAAVASVLSAAALVLAWLRSPSWPTMSSRYDAPAVSAGGPVEPDEIDLWKALDQGRDPTDPASPPSP